MQPLNANVMRDGERQLMLLIIVLPIAHYAHAHRTEHGQTFLLDLLLLILIENAQIEEFVIERPVNALASVVSPAQHVNDWHVQTIAPATEFV